MEKKEALKLSEPKIVDVYKDRSYWDHEKKQTRHKRETVGKRLAMTCNKPQSLVDDQVKNIITV